MLKNVSHEGLMLSSVYQKLLLQSVMSDLNCLKHREHPLRHLLLDRCLTSLLGCQKSLLLCKRVKYSSQSRVNGRRVAGATLELPPS
jgi:hypothetical protein